MIRLIIVEDEPVIRSGLERHIPWRDLGVGEVKSAANAEDALSAFRNYRPDIILSDIRMPGMNGIELCKRYRENLPGIQIIFISGFSDKEYLMSAIRLGAVSYVEKPVSIEELSTAVKKAIVSVDELNRQETSFLHSFLCMDPCSGRKSMNLFLKNGSSKIPKTNTEFRIGILKTRVEIQNLEELTDTCREVLDSKMMKGHITLTADSSGPCSAVFLYSSGGECRFNEQQIPVICRETLSAARICGDCFLGIGKRVNSLLLLSDSYRTASDALASLSYKGWNQYALYNEHRSEFNGNLSGEERNLFYRFLLDGKSEEAQAFLDKIYQGFLKEHDILNFYVRNLYYQLYCEIYRAKQRIFPQCTHSQNRLSLFMDEAQTIWELHRCLCEKTIEFCRESEKAKKSSSAVVTILKYLNEKPGDKNISIRMLADMVYLTPTYLSGIFKKQTGVTIGQYLTKIRIERAEQYLKDPRFRLYQVAALCGYEDSNYFGKIFKKRTGMLPSEYRENKMT